MHRIHCKGHEHGSSASQLSQHRGRLPVLEVVDSLLLPVHVCVAVILVLAVEIGELSSTGRQVHLRDVNRLGPSDDWTPVSETT